MHDEEQKLKGWAKSLGDAGFLDDVEDGWSLPERLSDPGSKIRVDGADLAVDGPVPEARQQSFPTKPALIRSAKRTFSGIPTPASLTPVPGDSWAELAESPPAGEQEAIELELDPEPESQERVSITARSRRVSVPPAPIEEDLGGVGTIVEELPLETGSRQQMRETVRPGRHGMKKAGEAATDAQWSDQSMTDLAEIGDFSGALAAAEAILKSDPGHGEARGMRERCRTVLLQMYESRLGSLDRIPSLAIAEKELVWRNLDAVTGFILSRVDGFSSFEDIIDVSSLPRFETCRILDQLLQEGLLRVE